MRDRDRRGSKDVPAAATSSAESLTPPLQALVQRFGGAGAQRAIGKRGQTQAAEGTRGAGEALPHRAAIQRSFGAHDVQDIKAHSDGAAAQSADAIGARAYAKGNDVAFGEAPDLHTAAHEAAHIVQQRGGLQLPDGEGKEGDAHERHADEVADRVTRGAPAGDLLNQVASPQRGRGGAAAPSSGGGASVQRLVKDGDKEWKASELDAFFDEHVAPLYDKSGVKPTEVDALSARLKPSIAKLLEDDGEEAMALDEVAGLFPMKIEQELGRIREAAGGEEAGGAAQAEGEQGAVGGEEVKADDAKAAPAGADPEAKLAEGDAAAEEKPAEAAADPVQTKLDAIADLEGDALAGAVADMSREDTQAIIALASGKAPYEDFLAKFTNERAAAAALQAKGKFSWIQGGAMVSTATFAPKTEGDDKDGATQTNDFIGWLYTPDAPEPADDAHLNCWQSVLLSVFRAGVITKDFIKQIHDDATGAGKEEYDDERSEGASKKDSKAAGAKAWEAAMEKGLKADQAKERTADRRPQRGDIVFMNGIEHVAISLGPDGDQDKVMSLWLKPHEGAAGADTMQETTVQELDPGDDMLISFAASPWT